jgi:hypothetical protein
VLDGILVLADELVQVGDVDAVGVGAGRVETLEKRRGWLPGHRLVADAVAGEELACRLVEFLNQFGGTEGGCAGGFCSELGVASSGVSGCGLGRKAAHAVEKLAADNLFAALVAGWCAGAAADVHPLLVG